MPIYQLKILNRQTVAKNTIQLDFEKPAGFQYKPGQYGGFTLINPTETDANGITRRFSLLSSPDDDRVSIATRIQTSAYKKVLNQLPMGSEIKFAGPTGNFILHDDLTTPAVLIAGGIGIAPFHSMIRYHAQHHTSLPIYLFYGNQTMADAAFFNELNDYTKENTRFSFIPTFAAPEPDWKGETGFVDDKMVKRYITDINVPIYYVCGSPAMVTAIQELLSEMGINEERIKVEDFPGY